LHSRLVDFLAGSGADHVGRTFEDVLAFSDAELERRHDFIQWLFPLPEPSRAVPSAPVMDEAERRALSGSETAKERMARAAERMLAFYGANDHWKMSADHNHLRITRIIRSMRLILGDAAADGFRERITALAAGTPIPELTRRYWARA
jgi:hypothetical protein